MPVYKSIGMHLSAVSFRRLRARVAVLAGLGLLMLAVAPTVAGARTATGPWGPVGLTGPAGPQHPAPAAGLRASPASRARVSRALKRATGYSLSQVAAENICSNPKPGHASCLAQLLVVAGTHRPVRLREPGSSVSPLVEPQAGFNPASEPAASSPPPFGSPAYLQQAYDLGYLSATNGASDTIAVVDAYDYPTAESDLANFRSQYGLPACTSSSGCFTEVNQSGASSPLPSISDPGGWGVEAALDLDAVSALCPNCRIVFVEANSQSFSDLKAGVATAASLGANQISMSFGTSPTWTEPSGPWTFSGVSSFAASGDNGSIGGGYGSFPAADPGVIAVGGTSLAAAANTRGFSESAWSDGGSGCAISVAKPSWQTDSGCSGRTFADVSADGDPATGLGIYDSSYDSTYPWLLVGGTSLSTPLTAAYAALTGVDSGHTPQWSYTDAGFLNDIVSGSNGGCGTYVCNAGTGYDGPTGNGSISGDVVQGGPGVAGAYGTGLSPDWTSVTLAGGVYPNGLQTTYHWEYGTTTAYSNTTTATTTGAGSSLVSISTPITGLTPGVTYHFRLVASNSDATVYGYDETFHSYEAPQVTAKPSISSSSGKFEDGATLTVSGGTWNPSGSVSRTWKRCTGTSGTGSSKVGAGCTSISGATAGTRTATDADVGHYLEAAVKETNFYGSTTVVSAPVGPIAGVTPKVISKPYLTTRGRVLRLTGGSYQYGSVASVEFRRCASGRRCLFEHTTTLAYRAKWGDQGRILNARATIKGPGGRTWVYTKKFLMLSAIAGVRIFRAGRAHHVVVRGTTRHALARVRARTVRTSSGLAERFVVHSVRHRPIVVWACANRCVRHRFRSTLTFTNNHISARDRIWVTVILRHHRLRHVVFRRVRR